MIAFTHEEAILFRILQSLFGHGQVIPHMSVKAICGGLDPTTLPESPSSGWKCLFTVVDSGDMPKLVVEFSSTTSQTIDMHAFERVQIIGPILAAHQIRYMVISDHQNADITHPAVDREFLIQFFREKCGDVEE